MAVRPIKISVIADASKARRELAGLGQSVKRGLSIVGFTGITVGLAGLVKSAVDTEREFSLTMRTIQANTGATAAEIDKMGKLAVDAGAKMGFSARESAGAMLELAKAGLDTKTIIGGGLASTLKVAAAGGTDLATASTIAANAMNAFSIASKDMDSIAVALAGGANASTASVESLGIALAQVGPGATIAGLSLQETVATLAAFDNAGIKGSDSGTSLKTMLTRLVPATNAARKEAERLGLDFTKADGSFVSLEQIAGRLKRALGGLSAEQRTTALRTIFGSDATRAATVLMREGSRGIRKYIDATYDQDAAQKAVNARTTGTEGAMKRLSAALEQAKLTLGRELAPAVIKGADAFGDKFVPAMEAGLRAGKQIARALAPAASEIAEALGHLSGEGEGAGKMFTEVFIPALTKTSEAVGSVVDFIDDLPGPVKELGLQVGVAALVFPRFAAGVATATGAVSFQIARLQQLRAELTYTATRAQITGAAMARFGAAAKTAAGIGGMVLLTKSTNEANASLSILERTLGGALVGLAVAGPAGAAIGGVAGLASSFDTLKNSISNALLGESEWNQSSAHVQAIAQERAEAVKGYADSVDRLRASLNQFTGAVTAQTRVTALDELERQLPGITAEMDRLGISQRTLAKAATGNADALAKVNALYAATDGPLKKFKFGQDEVGDALDNVGMKVGLVSRDLRNQAKVTQDLTSLQGKIPKRIYTKLEASGIEPTVKGIARIVRQFGLVDGKQIKAIIQATGAETTVRDVLKVARAAKTANKDLGTVGKVNPSPQLKNKLSADLGQLRAAVRPQIVGLNSSLATAGSVKPNMAPFTNGINSGINSAKGTANRGGYQVGVNLGNGFSAGVQSRAAILAAVARNAVLGAISVANKAGDIRSPSRKTRYTGEMLGAGLADGLRRTTPKAKTAGQKLIQSVLAGVKAGSSGVGSALDKVTASVRKAITGKNQGKREAAYLKSLRDEYAALKRSGAAQDRVAAKLEKARDRLKELTDQYNDYRKAIVDSITTTGDVTQLGRNEDGTVSITGLINELKNKVVAAQRFSVLLRDLAGKGLSRTAIQQMLDAGPEAALATAEAISFGGSSAIKEINDLQAELAKTGSQLGDSMADRYYGAGVRAAEGLVKGLEAQAKNLDKAAVRLANALVKAVKKALGIKSPSRVFTGIGDNVTKGLVIGLDDTYVKRSGAVMAASLQKGFGTPALDAYASQGAAGAAPIRVEVRLTAEQVSSAQRGKAILIDIAAAQGQGARTSAVVGP